MFINNPGHMTKMAAMPIYGKNPSKFFFSGTTGPISMKLGMKHWELEYDTTGRISMKLGMKHWELEYYNIFFINYDLWMTLT